MGADEASPITNLPDNKVIRKQPAVEYAWLYRPREEWSYSHHASICWFKGQYLAIWSNGRVNEDDAGQRVLISRSAGFKTWSTPEPLVDSTQGEHSELVLTACGFHQHDGTLVAYVGQYEYKQDKLTADGVRTIGDDGHMNTGLWAMTSTDGQNWSPLRALGLPLVANHGPEATASGRLIISSGFLHPWTDDPAGLSGWNLSSIYPADEIKGLADDSEGINIAMKNANSPSFLCEGSWYQTSDGVIHMLLRSNTPRLWVCESSDNGMTWSPARPTEFSDDSAKFHCGQLPDGRAYCIGNPDRGGGRLPLVLAVSQDGVIFDQQYILGDIPYELQCEGMHKGGHYGYPHSIVHDGWLCVIYSRCKEAVQVLRVRLSDLD